jgi:UDP-N-acetylglucosamine 2-epimerase (non-hydrolysing)
MKIVTILGTRPEIIRLSLIIKKLDLLSEHILVHTGQNYETCLSDIFFKELGLRTPDFYLGVKANLPGSQIALIMEKVEQLFIRLQPDKVLILGDTNSGLSALIAERMGIRVYHMEAGNRCFDMEVPEEVNRKIIDSISSFAIPYTPGSRENLLNEGVHKSRIFVSGNPINEVLNNFYDEIEKSAILESLDCTPKNYFLVTAHRAENVDNIIRLAEIFKALEMIAAKYRIPVICSIHPRTKNKMEQSGIRINNQNIKLYEPFGFFDFAKLEKNALLVLTDSGTVQEECCIFDVPTVTVRHTTERPETVQCGSNIVSGLNADKILECTGVMLSCSKYWDYPEGYTDINVSDKIVKYILGANHNV